MKNLFSLSAFAALLAAPAMAESVAPPCSDFTTEKSSWSCFCDAKAAPGSVWGSGPYTGDSDVCTAARHAGVIGAEGGMVSLKTVDGQASYSGSEANGVITRDWGSFAQSIAFPPPAVTSDLAACGRFPTGTESHSCFCAADASKARDVWGSGPYTGDSDICAAAFHAGAVEEGGGEVTVLRVPGLKEYTASEAAGVATSDWGGYDFSITFNRN
ncbi:LCCL domain-containing protein [Oceanicola sp. 502str15]|uniref:LCCL domain-containing protein n=1 Tax=Oceanicola sp. 502str15 TaxID=2696061 RepID=UPI002094E957|nr:LCCL domain-containing protein [Oceanicola sp. 502str15]MCO6382353.1 hypothetical protein [Oceanicola sp. 502str15]